MNNLSDIRPKTVKLKLDKERSLRYNLNALALIEERYGDIQKAVVEAQNGKVTIIRTLLWAGLVHEDKDLSEEQVGDMVDVADLERVAKAIGDAFGAAMPEPDSKNGNRATQ